MSTHNLCFEQKYEKYQILFLSENFQFLKVKFSIYLNRRIYIMVMNLITNREDPGQTARCAGISEHLLLC